MNNATKTTEENTLLAKVIYQKDKTAFARLHSIYYLKLKHYITKHANSSNDTEDLIQNLFLEIWEGNGHYDDKRNAEAYIFGIAKNLIRHYYRDKYKSAQIISIETVKNLATNKNSNLSEALSLDQLRKLFSEAAEKLPPKAKEAIKIRVIEGLFPKEAAKKCGCSRDAFYKRLHAAFNVFEKIRTKGNLKDDDVVNL